MGKDAQLTQDGFAQKSNVSRETLADYAHWHTLLQRWNKKINLIAPSTLVEFWGRHALDSWQICPHLPKKANIILDLGSGAGFPGLAAAIHLKNNALAGDDGANSAVEPHVHLVESAGKKASFLKTVIRELKLPATVHARRIEDLPPMRADVVMARAFAPLPRLFDYALPHIHSETMFILPKGEAAELEVENALDTWTFSLETVKSVTQEGANILIVTNLSLNV
ncbi:MAG: 16S rRNA (guanine(527)-N(7))-methyltransferase RsmG [Litorimonas sp.]